MDSYVSPDVEIGGRPGVSCFDSVDGGQVQPTSNLVEDRHSTIPVFRQTIDVGLAALYPCVRSYEGIGRYLSGGITSNSYTSREDGREGTLLLALLRAQWPCGLAQSVDVDSSVTLRIRSNATDANILHCCARGIHLVTRCSQPMAESERCATGHRDRDEDFH
jgi:hypothetical protein